MCSSVPSWDYHQIVLFIKVPIICESDKVIMRWKFIIAFSGTNVSSSFPIFFSVQVKAHCSLTTTSAVTLTPPQKNGWFLTHCFPTHFIGFYHPKATQLDFLCIPSNI